METNQTLFVSCTLKVEIDSLATNHEFLIRPTHVFIFARKVRINFEAFVAKKEVWLQRCTPFASFHGCKRKLELRLTFSTLSLSHTHTHEQSLFLSLTGTCTHAQTRSRSLSLLIFLLEFLCPLSLSLFLSLSLSLSLSHAISLFFNHFPIFDAFISTSSLVALFRANSLMRTNGIFRLI